MSAVKKSTHKVTITETAPAQTVYSGIIDNPISAVCYAPSFIVGMVRPYCTFVFQNVPDDFLSRLVFVPSSGYIVSDAGNFTGSTHSGISNAATNQNFQGDSDFVVFTFSGYKPGVGTAMIPVHYRFLATNDDRAPHTYNQETKVLSLCFYVQKYDQSKRVWSDVASTDDLFPITLYLAGTYTYEVTTTSEYTYRLNSPSVTWYNGIPLSEKGLESLKIVYDLKVTKSRAGETISETTSTDKLYKAVQESDVAEATSTSFAVNLGMTDSAGNDVWLTAVSDFIDYAATSPVTFTPTVTGYETNQTIRGSECVTDFSTNGSGRVHYEDGSSFPFSTIAPEFPHCTIDVEVDGEMAFGQTEVYLDPFKEYGDCQVKIEYSLPNGQSRRNLAYSVVVSNNLPASLEIANQKTAFKAGETYEYGQDATYTLFNRDGEEVEMPEYDLEYLFEGGYATEDQKIGEKAKPEDADSNYQTTIITTLQNGYKHTYKADLEYCGELNIDEETIPLVFVSKGVSADISPNLSEVGGRYVHCHRVNGSPTRSQKEFGAEANRTYEGASISFTQDGTANVTLKFNPPECPAQTLSASFPVSIVVTRFVSLQIATANAGVVYYEGRKNAFEVPTDLAISLVSNNPSADPSTREPTETEKATIKYFDDKGNELTPNVTEFDFDVRSITVTLLPDGQSERITGSYEITRQPDSISSFAIEEAFSFVLGNRLSKYKQDGTLKITATYASGYEEEGYSDYEIAHKGSDGAFAKTDPLIMASSELSDIGVYAGGSFFALSSEGKITAQVPTGKMTLSPLRNAYSNGEAIDFTGVVAHIEYEGADPDVAVDATLGEVATTTQYSLSCEGLSAFDGTQSFDIAEAGPAGVSKTFTATAKNRFDQNTNVTATHQVSVYEIDPTKIDRISVRVPYGTYQVGEEFLNQEDTTQVVFYFNDGTPQAVHDLRDMGTILLTQPAMGSVFTAAVDSQQVIVQVIGSSDKYTTYNIRVQASASSTLTKTTNIAAIHIENGTQTQYDEFNKSHQYYDASGNPVVSGYYVLVDESLTEIDSDGERVLRNPDSIKTIHIFGYLEDCFNASLNARVILFEDYIPPVQGQANITVEFPCHVDGNADKIDKCRLAKLFGNANAKNRLFASGNPDIPNCDWHSGEVDGEDNGDFTYWGDTDYCFYGQSDNEVRGYDIVATDKMVVLKSPSKVEPTNYFRTSTLVQAIDASGNSVESIDGRTLYMESFPLATGNVGIGALSLGAIANLNGDTLFLAEDNTICGLDISGQVGDSQRIASSRSRYIDPDLKGLDLSKALLWTDNEKLLLCAEECTYLTDYRTLDSDTYQYEWFKIDVGGITAAISIGGDIYFGKADGSFYKTVKGRYYDTDKLFAEAGTTLYAGIGGGYGKCRVSIEQAISDQLAPYGDYWFKALTPSLAKTPFRRIGRISNQEGPNVDFVIDYPNNAIKLVALGADGGFDAERYVAILDELAEEDTPFYLNKPDGYGSIQGDGQFAEYYRPYMLKALDGLGREYAICDEQGNELKLSTEYADGSSSGTIYNLVLADLCRPLDGEYQMGNIDKEKCEFDLLRNNRQMEIVYYADQKGSSADFPSEIHKHRAVQAFFITAPAVLGSLNHRKTIWAWTLTAHREANDLEVCQANNERNLEELRPLNIRGPRPVGFDFGDVAFKAIDFERDSVPRKYTYIRPISVPFMCFGFRSLHSAPSALTAVSIVYSVPLLGRGRR